MRIDQEPGVLANRYSLQTALGRTSVGVVWLATDTVLDRTVIVTLVDPRIAANDAARERLFGGARALAAAPASRLVRLLDAGIDGELPFLVTERIAGETLAEILDRDGRLPAGRAAAIVADVLDGLAEAHAASVLHLDVTPTNVVIDERGRVRLRNAGIAQAALDADGVLPSPIAPPEGPAVDARSDVWSAGALLWTLITGRCPDDSNAASPDGIDAPRAVRSILARSLASDPAERFPDATAAAAALRSAAARERPATVVGSRLAVFRTWLAVPLVVTLVAALVVGAGVWFGRFEIGGPIGIRLHEPTAPSSSAAALPVAGVSVLDPPPGDGLENDDALPDAIDGDPATVWRSENYYDGTLNKPGVGLLLDLGGEATVTGFRLDTPVSGFTFSIVVGNDPEQMPREAAGAVTFTAPAVERELDPRDGRYVLVWITSVVPVSDGNRAEISEIRVFGTS
jgi:eukaryotic-like serine/threonine-protein kinase